MRIQRSLLQLAGVFLFTLAGISSASAADSKGIVFWNCLQTSDVTDALGKAFTKVSKIPVEVDWIPPSDYKPVLLRHAADGDLPDVALVPSDYLGVNKELDLSAIPSDLRMQGVIPAAFQGGMYEGQQLGVPVFWGNHLMLYYNKKYVKTPAASFEEMEGQIKELAAKGVKPLGTNFGEMYWYVPFMGAFGAWPVVDGKLALDSAANTEALDYYFSLVDKGLTLKDCHLDCALERFQNGEFAYAINGDWAFRDNLAKMGADLGVATLPTIGKRHLVPMFSSYVLIFPKQSLHGPKREQLLKFIHYMQSNEVQKRWFTDAGLFPVNDKVFREVTESADANTKASLAQLKMARAMPNDRIMAFAWEGMAQGYSRRFNGKGDSAEAVSRMQTHAERMAARAQE